VPSEETQEIGVQRKYSGMSGEGDADANVRAPNAERVGLLVKQISIVLRFYRKLQGHLVQPQSAMCPGQDG
jgi:hypothetical protein